MEFNFKVVFLILFSICNSPLTDASRNGGIPCIACSIVVGLTEQLAQYHNETVSEVFSKICAAFPRGEYQDACFSLTKFFGPIVIDLLYMKATPDLICRELSLCYTEPKTEQCHLYPEPVGGFSNTQQKNRKVIEALVKKHKLHDFIHMNNEYKGLPKICMLPGISILCEIFNRVEENMLPALDLDNDYYSTVETLRGSAWRGKDCNDFNPYIHPGAKPINGDREVDSNCNGIYGVDPTTGKTYEELFCAGTNQRGIAILGDSVSAHFHIPPEWVKPSQIDYNIFTHLPYVLGNELDWPMMSFFTGYKNLTWPIIDGPTRSVYMKLRQHNRCNHRDFQNLAVNGADSFNLQQYQLALSRDNGTDQPLLVAIALVGNDVCNKYDDTVAHMTTAKQMYDNLHKTLTFVNELVPRGSHVLFTGVADGRYLYEFMHKRVHPLGNLNKDISYSDLYTYLNCLDISPCRGWMNTNGTTRNATAQRVVELNKAIVQLVKDSHQKFSQFDVSYIENPVKKVIDKWEKVHGPGSGYELIEPMDGFHPNQFAQALIGDYIWDYVLKNLPHLVGEPNPHNKKIKEIFGDQGGY